MESYGDSELYAEIFDRVPSAIVVLDTRGVVSRANASALVMLGVEVLEGRTWREVIREVFRPRKDDGHEISTRDGRRLQVATLPLSHGQLIQMTDLTNTRKLQDTVSHMERLSSLGRMSAALAHQIRTPLSAAMLYASNLGNARLSDEARASFQKKLVSRLEALNGQIDNILMFARSNQQTASLLDASGVIEQSVSNVAANIAKAGAELRTSVDSGPMPIMANQSALSGAISNLVVNAVEAGARTIVVSLSRLSGDEICFEVANDSPAIDDRLRPRIFEPFFTSKSHGTGLGLAVVSAVAKVHHGRIELTGSDDYPTIFKLYMPIFSREETAESPEEHDVDSA